MATDVVMPQMGESITEGTLTKWLKKVGDTVQRDEPLFEISTDKVDAEIPSPAAGTLQEIKIAEGATVQINTVVAVIGEGAGAAAPPPPNADSSAALRNDKQAAPAATPAPATPAAAAPAAPAASGPGTDVPMPQMGESITEGTITKWLKQVGESVERDEPLFEISTDKVDAEIPSPAAGVLTEIKFPEGSTVQINTIVAVIGGSGGGAAETAPPHPLPLLPRRLQPLQRQPLPLPRPPQSPEKNSAPRRWSARSPRTTTSTSPRSRAQAPPDASPNPTSSATSKIPPPRSRVPHP